MAAAIDSSFRDKYLNYIDKQIRENFSGKSRQMVQIARGIIDRWSLEHKDTEGFLDVSKSLNRVASEMLHHSIGFSGKAEEVAKARPEILKMLSGRVRCASANVLLAIQVIGEDDTDAWRRAAIVFVYSPLDQGT